MNDEPWIRPKSRLVPAAYRSHFRPNGSLIALPRRSMRTVPSGARWRPTISALLRPARCPAQPGRQGCIMGREMRTQLARQAGIEGHARAGVVLLKSCLDPSLDPEEVQDRVEFARATGEEAVTVDDVDALAAQDAAARSSCTAYSPRLR